MPQSLAKVIVPIVYSTKHRQPWLHDPTVRSEWYAYIATILKEEVASPAILINGVEDHVHILCLLCRKFAIMDVIEGKRGHSTLLATKSRMSPFPGPVSPSNVEQVKRYIANQEEHHQRISFQDEFREICKRDGIGIDERYVWD